MSHSLDHLVQTGLSLADTDKALILLHGRGATAESILTLADDLEAFGYAILAPQATGNQWYPNRFIAPKEQNEPHLSSALELLEEVVGKLNNGGIATDKIVIAGFSQGACLASEFVAQHPARYGGLLVFSGGLIGLGPTVHRGLYNGSLDNTPVFMGCSDVDFHIPIERFERSGQILSDLGAEVNLKVYPGMDHTIIQDEIDEAKKLLAKV